MKKFIFSGDPSGIGPEITLKALARKKAFKTSDNWGCNYFEDFAKKLKLNLKIIEEGSKSEGKIKHFPINNKVILGKPQIDHSNYIIDVLSYGSLGCLRKNYHSLVTGPINKELINKSGFEFSGHTEFLADISNVKKVVMLLMNKSLKIALLTTHIPLSEVPKKVTIENLQKTIDIIDRDLVRIWKVRNPKIGILGLNPHAGEGGFLGSEEEEIIKPFIKSSKKDLYGPISADTAFISNNLKKYDLFLAMFHDQGLPVIHKKSFELLNFISSKPSFNSSKQPWISPTA